YRRGLSALAAPIGLLRRHARRLDVAGLVAQVYLEPHPVLLAVRARDRARSSRDASRSAAAPRSG
ncbi:MAG: DUF1722 domain-containing protein, partial [Candidatus Binatia bacterium]